MGSGRAGCRALLCEVRTVIRNRTLHLIISIQYHPRRSLLEPSMGSTMQIADVIQHSIPLQACYTSAIYGHWTVLPTTDD